MSASTSKNKSTLHNITLSIKTSLNWLAEQQLVGYGADWEARHKAFNAELTRWNPEGSTLDLALDAAFSGIESIRAKEAKSRFFDAFYGSDKKPGLLDKGKKAVERIVESTKS